MEGRHDLLPQLGSRVAADLYSLLLVVAGPHGGHIVGGAAYEPTVHILAGAAGLAGHGDAPQGGLGAGAVLHGVLQQIGEGIGGVGLESLYGAGGIVDDDAALAVGKHGVGAAVGEDTVVDDGAVGLGHLPHGAAVIELTQGHGGVGDVVLRDEAGKAQMVDQIVVGGLGTLRQDIHYLGSNGVDGVLQGGVNGDQAHIAAAVVGGQPVDAVEHHVGGVHDRGLRGDEAQVDGRAVSGQGLDGGAGGPLGAGGPVQTEVDGLFSHAAAETQDAPVIGVHDDDGALELLVAAPGVGYGFQVGVDGVDIVLDVYIQAGVDIVAAVIQQGLGGVLADALELHQVLDHIVDDHLGIVGVDGLGILLPGAAGEDQFLRHCVLVLLVVDVTLLVHLPEYGLLAVLVVLLVIEGVVIGGQVGDAHDGGALGQGQVLGVLAEVGLGGHLNAVGALPEVDGVEIPLHYLLLVITLLQLKGSEYFRELALDGDVVLAGKVLYQLLGDGGTAVAGVHFGEHGDEGAGSAVPVHALVLIKAFVFNGH